MTGGAGFIGSHTVDLLIERGYEVVVLDNLQPRVHPDGRPAWVPPSVEFIEADVADHAALARAMAGAHGVLHLAAYQDYMPDFSRFIHTNAESAALIFELAVSDPQAFPLRKVVFASSQAVSGEGRYLCPDHGPLVPAPRPIEQLERGDWEVHCPTCGGTMRPLPINEATVSPGTAYGISKYTIELLADRLGRRYGIPAACMRYSYVQGPRNSLQNAYSGVARRFALQLMNGRPPTVYEDGEQLRDFIHVRDVAQANVLVFEDDRADFGVFNVGGGRAYTVLELAERMIAYSGKNVAPQVTGEFRVGDTRHTVSDTSRLEALGWRPEHGLDDNIRDYIDWLEPMELALDRLTVADREMRARGVLSKAVRRPA